MNKKDGRAVQMFTASGNPKSLYTYGHMHCYELGKYLLDRLHVCFSHVFHH